MTFFKVEYMKEKHKVRMLKMVAQNHRGVKQQQAIRALCEIGDGEAARALLQLSAQEDIAVWEPAQEALASIRNEAAVPALCESLLGGEYRLTKPVLAALTNMENDLALNGLLKALEDPKITPDVLTVLHGKKRVEMVEPLDALLMKLTGQTQETTKDRLWQQSLCREIIELLSEVDEIETVRSLHHFLRERPDAQIRLREMAAHALMQKGENGKCALAGYVGEDLTNVPNLMLFIKCLPDELLCDILFEVMPPQSADELGSSLMTCMNRMDAEFWPQIVPLLERLDRDNVRSALLLWFVQSKAACPEAAYALARHGNTRPVLVKRLVDMVRFEGQAVRLRAGNLIKDLYLRQLISTEGVHLIRPLEDKNGIAADYEYIGYKD